MSEVQRQEIAVENIPDELKQGRHWLCWRLEQVRDRWTKVPYRPFGPLRKARSNDPGTWGTFEQALRYRRSHLDLTGIGIAFAGDLVGIDLDHCIVQGEIQPWARATLERLHTYCERSPSGTGVHCLVRGSLPQGRHNVALPHLGEGCRIEMYDARSPRYFTVTGAAIGECRTVAPAQAALDELYAQYMRPQTPAAVSTLQQARLSDEVILAKAQQAANAAKFERLLRGDLSEYAGDHSKADLALCGILAFYTDDPGQIDRLFRRSALLRPKWDERHSSDNQTYGQLTIQKVLEPSRPRYGQSTGRSDRLPSQPPGDWRDVVSGPPPWLADGAKEDIGTARLVVNQRTGQSRRRSGPEPGGNGHEPAAAAGSGATNAASADNVAGEDPEREDLTDLGNARRLVRSHGRDLRHVTGWGWLRWTGQRWQRSEKYVMRCAKAAALSYYDDAAELLRPAKQQAVLAKAAAARGDKLAEKEAQDSMNRLKERAGILSDWAKASQSRSRLEALVRLAESEPAVTAEPADFDAEPWLLNCTNGTVDLRTGTLQPHRREDRLTKLAPVAYDPTANCPTFTKFLQRIMNERQELIAFLQRLIGYALTGSVREQMLFFWYGAGANGKSTLLNILLAMLGQDYARQAAPDVLTVGRDRHPTELADLAGVRLVASIEVAEGKQLAEAVVKQMTGGDKVKARFMRQDFFEFDPTFKIFLAANHKPVIKGTDHAIWRRIKLIPFEVTIPEEEQDKELLDKLRAEMPGILAWAVRGCLDWQKNGLGVPEDVKAATAAYRDESDLLATFLAECTEFGATCQAQAGALFKAYRAWAANNGLSDREMLSNVRFGRQLGERGFDKYVDDGSHRTYYIGLRLLESAASSSSNREANSGSARGE